MTKTKAIIERGLRLRSLREQTGLTRSQFAKEVNISEHTLKSFELGTRELPIQKAREYSRIFLFAGIDVSFDFLYYGREPDPGNNNDIVINDNINIQNEIVYFKKNNPASIILTIQDTLMSPFYNKGDIVGGQKVTNESQFSLLQGRVCIIEDMNGQQRLRRIIKCDQRIVTACTLKTEDKKLLPLIEEIEAYSIAQVTRHWHIFELSLTNQPSTKSMDFSISTP